MQKRIAKLLTLAAGRRRRSLEMPRRNRLRHGILPPAPAAKAQHTPAAKTASVPALKTPKDKASYAIGLNIGKSMHRDAVDIDPNVLLRGLKDGLAGSKPLLTDDEIKSAMMALQNVVRQRQEVKMQQAGETNKKAGEAFLVGQQNQARRRRSSQRSSIQDTASRRRTETHRRTP